MGIYADVKYEKQGDTLIVHTSLPGVVTSVIYQKVAAIESRDDCFCCTCGEREGSDSCCRNHGWWGKRPCDIHDLPGQVDEDGNMPETVKQVRARQEESQR